MRLAVVFVFGLSVLLGLYGYLTKSPLPLPARDEAESQPTVEVFIPALNEAETIAFAITSLARQTITPERVTIVDDGSTDETAAVVEHVRNRVDLEIDFVRHTDPGSKTKRLKQVTRNSTADKIFVLDADTYLVSETYLERLTEAHAAENVACSFGIVRPDSRTKKRSVYQNELRSLFPDGAPAEALPEWIVRNQTAGTRPSYLVTKWPVERYRSVMYSLEQRFFKESQMRLIRTTLFPVGCGVLYDRTALRSVFDDFESSLGNQLTNSEDIFIGFSLLDRGYANVQVPDVTMRTVEPTLAAMADQTYLWSSSFLQSAYYYRLFSQYLRSWSGDVTGKIQREPNRPTADETDTVETDGGTVTPDAGCVGPRPANATVGESLSESAARIDDPPAVGVPTNDGVTASAEENDEPEDDDQTDGSRRFDRRTTLSAVVAFQIFDGLYPTALLFAGLLTLLGLFPLEFLLLIVVGELVLYCLVAWAFARREVSLSSIVVSIPVRLSQLPIGVYVYGRMATDILTGNRNWNK